MASHGPKNAGSRKETRYKGKELSALPIVLLVETNQGSTGRVVRITFASG